MRKCNFAEQWGHVTLRRDDEYCPRDRFLFSDLAFTIVRTAIDAASAPIVCLHSGHSAKLILRIQAATLSALQASRTLTKIKDTTSMTKTATI